MKKMTKKALIIILPIIFITIMVVLYFLPKSLTNLISDDASLAFSITKLNINNDYEELFDNTDYNHVTDEQKKLINEVFQKYPYQRDLATLFSDGIINDFSGNGFVYMWISQDGEDNIITLSHDDEIVINNKNYTMKNSSELLNEIFFILENID